MGISDCLLSHVDGCISCVYASPCLSSQCIGSRTSLPVPRRPWMDKVKYIQQEVLRVKRVKRAPIHASSTSMSKCSYPFYTSTSSADTYRATMPSSSPEESLPLLSPSAPSSSSQPHLSPISRSRLGARRHISLPLTDKAKGKQRAVEPDLEAQSLLHGNIDDDGEEDERKEKVVKKVEKGRRVTVIFSNEEKEGNLELWVEPDETVGKVKDQVSFFSQTGRNGQAEIPDPSFESHLDTTIPPPNPLRSTPDRRYLTRTMASITRRSPQASSVNNGRRRRVGSERCGSGGRWFRSTEGGEGGREGLVALYSRS